MLSTEIMFAVLNPAFALLLSFYYLSILEKSLTRSHQTKVIVLLRFQSLDTFIGNIHLSKD
ncbi:MAG: hypothetical protein HC784_04470 [Hydrococcus sp. CSU_1_8]|nr:hypothetical protein [Hydrococcus sp. CSU_1_8]